MFGGCPSFQHLFRSILRSGSGRRRHLGPRQFLVLAALISFAGCKKKVTEPEDQVASIGLSHPTITFDNGVQTAPVLLVATPKGDRQNPIVSAVVSFSSLDATTASVARNGDQTATITPTGAGTTTITVGSGNVNVNVSVTVVPRVRGITLNPNVIPGLFPGGQVDLIATLDADPKVSREVNWFLSSPIPAHLTRVSEIWARLTADAAGTADVTAKAAVDPTVFVTRSFTVSGAFMTGAPQRLPTRP